jgi:dihydrofolate synthase/folylpolyglutamate synthase
MRLPLLGRHQAANLVTAVAALETVGEVLGIEVPAEAVRAGVEAVAWPGRLQVLRRDPPVILDGAHNPGAAEALAAALKRLLKRRPVALVLGMCQDKDVVGFVKPFGGLVKRVWVVPIGSERNMAPGLIRSAAAAMGWEAAAADVAGALAGATAWAQAEGGAVCVTGSLFLVGEVLGGGCLRDPNEGGFTRSSQRGGGGGGGDRQTRD